MRPKQPRQFDWIKIMLRAWGNGAYPSGGVSGGAGKEWRLCFELDDYMRKAEGLKETPISPLLQRALED